MNTRTLLAAFAAVLSIITPALRAQVPQIINYQGRVAVGTVNFDGSGQFKFALVNAAGTTTFWSNDGTSVAGSQPTAAVALTVTKGLYSVLLGDTALPNMTVIPTSVFSNADVRLRVWFNDGVNGSQLLSPDQRIAAVGYAVLADGVKDGAITSAKIAAGAVGSTQLAVAAVQAGHLANGAVTSASLAVGAVSAGQIADSAVGSAQLADTVELGSATTSGRLDVFRNAAGTPSISLFGGSSQISTYGSDGLEQARLWGTSYGELLLNNSLANNALAVRLSAQGSSGGSLELKNSDGLNRAVLDGENTGGLLTLFEVGGAVGAILDGDDSGYGSLSLRNTGGAARLRAYGGPDAGRLDVSNAAGATTFAVDGESGSVTAQALNYASAQTRYLAVPAAAFRPTDNTVAYTSSGTGVLVTATGAGTASFTAPVFLPHGAVITGVKLVGLDNDASNDLTLRLRSAVDTANSSTILATVVTTGASATAQAVSSALLNKIVANDNERIFLSVNWLASAGSNIDLRQVTITYTVTSPAP